MPSSIGHGQSQTGYLAVVLLLVLLLVLVALLQPLPNIFDRVTVDEIGFIPRRSAAIEPTVEMVWFREEKEQGLLQSPSTSS